jgi:hypothetical protein
MSLGSDGDEGGGLGRSKTTLSVPLASGGDDGPRSAGAPTRSNTVLNTARASPNAAIGGPVRGLSVRRGGSPPATNKPAPGPPPPAKGMLRSSSVISMNMLTLSKKEEVDSPKFMTTILILMLTNRRHRCPMLLRTVWLLGLVRTRRRVQPHPREPLLPVLGPGALPPAATPLAHSAVGDL